MRLHVYQWLMCFSGCVGLWGCSQVETVIEGTDETEITIDGRQDEFVGTRTRSVIGGVCSDGGLLMQWGVGDKIGVFGTESDNEPFISTNLVPADETGFRGTIQFGETLKYAYYPYAGENTVTKEAVPVDIPTTQSYTDENSVAQYDVKASDELVALSDGSYKCRMRQMVTLLRFEINLEEVKAIIGKQQYAVPDDETLTEVTMTTAGGNMTGSYTYDLTNLDKGLTAGKADPTLTLQFTQKPALEGTLVAYAIVAPGRQEGQTLDCSLQTEHYSVQLTTTLLCDFEAGHYYVLPLNASVYENPDNKVEVAPTQEVEQPEDPVTGETANCYMVTETGEHSFFATQIGNGDKGIIPGVGFHVTSAKISPKSARLLWQDTENFVSDIRLSRGKVYYTANKNVGNAVIAVYSGEECTGEILWSWHIWGVGDTLPADDEVTNRNGATFKVMDRTLGALSATSYYATLYQWGRKDPVPNSLVYYVDGAAVDIETSYPVYPGDDITLSTLVQHPDKLALLPYEENNRYLWGDNNLDDAYTFKYPNYLDNATAEQTKGWTHQKTIYDPSPVGYRVASKFVWTGFVNNKSATNSSVPSSYRADYVNYVKYEDGYYFKRNADDTVGSYYPMTGSRGVSTGSLWVGGNAPYTTLNYTASYWSSAPNKNSGQAQCLSMSPYQNPNSSTVENSKNTVNALGFSYCQNAFAVRCVREE